MLPERFKNFVLSEGTLKDEDLVPMMLGIVMDYGDKRDRRYLIENYDVKNYGAINFSGSEFKVNTIRAYDPDKLSALITDLYAMLDRMAPSGCYFGAAEGDGALIGFWEVPDDYMF